MNPKTSKKSTRIVLTKKLVAKFYAVTMTSVYEAIIYGRNKVPWLLKIACRSSSRISVGDKISNGTMLSIGKQLILFVPEGSGFGSPMTTIEREINKVNTRWWGGGTSNVVALFLKKTDALECSKSANLKPGDERWKFHTIRVLRAVGEDHPYCSISTCMPDSWLFPPKEWKEKN